jgi:lysozyme
MKINPKVVDIYHGDNVSDFGKAFAFGIRGVIHKATEGSALIDSAYVDRRKRATAAGMHWGAYHFIRPGNIAAQAQRFVEAAAPDADTLMALDHEDPNVSLGSAGQFVKAVEAVLLERGLSQTLVLYSGFLIKEQIVGSSVGADDIAFWGARRLWLCAYPAVHADGTFTPPTWPTQVWKTPWLWQYTGDGDGPRPHDVPGLQTRMDINTFDGSDDDLARTWAAS